MISFFLPSAAEAFLSFLRQLPGPLPLRKHLFLSTLSMLKD
jgi:hypothetical protein